MKLVGIDSSSSVTGWSAFEDGQYKDSGILDKKKIKNADERFREMITAIWKKLDEVKPDMLVIETTVVVRNAQAQRKLSMILGSVYSWCLFNDCEYNELRPTEWRSLISHNSGGKKRDELKKWSKYQVKLLFDKDVTDDESDAILIGQALINKFDKM